MSDDLEQGINFLATEAGSPEVVDGFENADHAPSPQTETRPEAQVRHPQFIRPVISPLPAAAPLTPDKDPVLLEIENILSANLLEIYNELPENKREAFKQKGEEVASSIHEMILNTKVKVHKVLKLISDWLRMVPGINVYFLRQEAKIKLDRIVEYATDQAKHI